VVSAGICGVATFVPFGNYPTLYPAIFCTLSERADSRCASFRSRRPSADMWHDLDCLAAIFELVFGIAVPMHSEGGPER